MCSPCPRRRPLDPPPHGAQLQTLAHPLRSRLLGALRFHGPATSTALAARLGTNSGATSYHLRQLAEAGLVEDDPERSNGRDRWWRSVHDATSWRSTDYDDDPDARAADDWLVRRQAHVAAGWLNDWLEGRDEWSTEWRDAADQSDYHLDLHRRAAPLRSWTSCGPSPSATGSPAGEPDAERVTLLLQAFPSPERVV